MTLQALEVRIIVQDQMVRNAKEAHMRMQRRFENARDEMVAATDRLHDEQCQLQYLRDAFAARAA